MGGTRIEILDGAVTLRHGNGETIPVDGQEEPRTLALLAMSAPNPVPTSSLCRDRNEQDALQARISRLRKYGFDIPRSTARGYQLNVAAADVDGQQLLAAARLDRAHHTADTVSAALRLWRSGPPSFLENTATWDELHTARTKLANLLSTISKRRLLIVEDQVGQRLKRILGEFDCTLIESVEEFWPLYRRGLDEYFDAALVDLHLTPSYNDNDGLLIVGAICRSRLRIPVVLMTFEPSRDLSQKALLAQYNLEDFVLKRGDNETSDFHTVAETVRRLFEEDKHDIDARLIDQIQKELPRLRTYATKWLIEHGRTGDIPVMEHQHDELHRVSYQKDLAALREAKSKFDAKYGLPRPSGMQR